MRPFNHVMVDIETTGISKDHCAVIQITAVCFDPITRQIDHEWFDQCLDIPATRRWDESTRSWWLEQKEGTLSEIFAKMRDPVAVMREFNQWCGGSDCRLHFWAKPLSFDYPFIESYFNEFGPFNPFDFRKGRDLRTFLMGLNFPREPFDDRSVEFKGTKHNALFDVLHQIDIIFKGIDAS